MAKDALPTFGDDLATGGRDDALEGVEEAVLSGIDEMDHGGRNSSTGLCLSIKLRQRESREKLI
jgi:hypothetical protein